MGLAHAADRPSGGRFGGQLSLQAVRRRVRPSGSLQARMIILRASFAPALAKTSWATSMSAIEDV